MPQRLLAIALSLLLTACFLALVASTVSRDLLDRQQNLGLAAIERGEQWAMESNTFNDFASSLDMPACSDAMLRALRVRLFQYEYIKDAGYVSDGLLRCTTTLGRLPEPYQVTEPDYTSNVGNVIWIDEPLLLSPDTRGFIVQRGRFNAVFLLDSLRAAFPPGIDFEMVYNTPAQTLHIAGKPGTFRGFNNDNQFGVTASHHYFETCSDRISYCIGIQRNHWQFLANHWGLLTLVMLAATGVFAATHWLISTRLAQYNSIGKRVRRGLDRNRFHFMYQPIVDLNDGRIVGCEVLARFEDTFGSLSPVDFVPEIERQGLTWNFTEKAIFSAFNQLNRLDDLPDGFRVNVNFFPHDLYRNLSRSLPYIHPLQSTRFSLVVEVTEHTHMDTQSAQESLAWLAEQGYGVAIDDFGTGYSNLDKLHQLNCQTIKIDQSFVADIVDGGIKSTFIAYMVDIARELNVKIVAEGVETEVQERELRQLGVHYAQGWRYGKPLTAVDLARAVRDESYDGNPIGAIP